jgi:hypothetical protein
VPTIEHRRPRKGLAQTVAILSLPVFANKIRRPHPHHEPLLTTSSGPSTRQLEDRIGARRSLCSVLTDSIIIVKMHVVTRPSHSHIIDLTVRRTLLEFVSYPVANVCSGGNGNWCGNGARHRGWNGAQLTRVYWITARTLMVRSPARDAWQRCPPQRCRFRQGKLNTHLCHPSMHTLNRLPQSSL